MDIQKQRHEEMKITAV